MNMQNSIVFRNNRESDAIKLQKSGSSLMLHYYSGSISPISSINPIPPQNFSASIEYDGNPNGFPNDGYNTEFRIYSYKDTVYGRLYSLDYSSASVMDNGQSDTTYTINTTWSFSSGVDGYLVTIADDYNGYTFNVGFNTTSSSLQVDNAVPVWTDIPNLESLETYINNFNIFGNTNISGAININQKAFILDHRDSIIIGTNNYTQSYSVVNSTFIGQNAGYRTTIAAYSNFIGHEVGYLANGLIGSNFLGYQAGYSSSASNVNFIGTSAGAFTKGTAAYSNFIGYQSGFQATDAANSNFLGYFAGRSATNAYNSNFLGKNAGYLASTAYNSNFLGEEAGRGSSRADNSNFLGSFAGYTATSASYSNFLGFNTGYQASQANNSNFLGYYAGLSATQANNSNFLGQNAGYQASNANNSNFLGQNAGYQASIATNSNFIGQQAGYIATSAIGANFLGQAAGRQATNAAYSNFLGASVGNGATNATYSNFLGHFTGTSATSASYSTLLGYRVGYNIAGGALGIKSNNIIIGTNITLPDGTQDSINLGAIIFATGSYSTTTGNPFSGPVSNGRVGINKVSPQYTLDVSGSGNYTNGLTTTGSLNVSGSLNVDGTITATTLVVQTITSSTDYVTGSTRFGSLLSDTHQFTGSVSMTGSLVIKDTLNVATSATVNNIKISVGLGNVSNNIGIGSSSLSATTVGQFNIAIGEIAGAALTSANWNTLVGYNAGNALTTGTQNAFFGHNSGRLLTTFNYNTFYGQNAGRDIATGSENTFVGQSAGFGFISGTGNVIVGRGAAGSNRTGDYNIHFGYNVGINNTGIQNIFIGKNTGISVTSGSYNVIVGANNGSTISTLSNFILFSDGEGNERFRIPSTGNFLINTTTDTGYKFYVSGSDTSGSLNVDNTLYVNSSRNVLIGTTTDTGYKLRVNGGTTSNYFTLRGSGYVEFYTVADNDSRGGLLRVTSARGFEAIALGNVGLYKTKGNANTYIYFGGYSYNDLSYEEYGRFGGTGNFLLNTTNDPGYKLNVSGSGNFTNGLTVTGSLNISSGSITMPSRPAFRVTGTSSSDITATTTISGSAVSVDYNQGNYYTASSGVFTAPIAGLYSVYMNLRCGSINAQQQAIMYKNNTTSSLMWEAPGNTGVAHFGVSGILNLAANDTLKVVVAVGSIQFDGNDSYGAAYIG